LNVKVDVAKNQVLKTLHMLLLFLLDNSHFYMLYFAV